MIYKKFYVYSFIYQFGSCWIFSFAKNFNINDKTFGIIEKWLYNGKQ